jgi:hypothetical protein
MVGKRSVFVGKNFSLWIFVGNRGSLWGVDVEAAVSKLELVKVQPEPDRAAEARAKRYEQDVYAMRNLREAGRRASMKLLNMVENEAIWEALPDRVKVQLITLALDRAYGRVETVTAEEKATAGSDEVVGMLPAHLRALAGSLSLPEMAKSKRAEE